MSIDQTHEGSTTRGMKSVPPRGSGWLGSRYVRKFAASHPLPRGGTDFIPIEMKLPNAEA